MEARDTILSFLQTTAEIQKNLRQDDKFVYRSMEEFVIRNGHNYFPRKLHREFKPGKPKLCFNNVTDLVLKKPELTYVEGYAMGVIPVLHAWAVTSDGYVVDPTWTGRKGRPDLGTAYYGVPFDINFVLETITKKGTYGVIDDWKLGFPLLKGTAGDFSPRRPYG